MEKLNDTRHVSWQGVSLNPPGVDFFEKFSPVIGFDIVRTDRAISAMRGWNLRALDVKQAKLNAALSEEMSLELPDGSIVEAFNAICGLKQSALVCTRSCYP